MSESGVSNQLFELVYIRLKAMAGRALSRQEHASVNTTMLVHELYLRMQQGREKTFASQAQFFDYAAKAMRHILVDRARAKLRDKRGGGKSEAPLELAADVLSEESVEQAIELDDALRRLAEAAPRAAKVVELHYFAGLPLEDIARYIGVSERTVNREWRFARAWLHAGLK